MTFSELVRLLCRLLPCIPQSLRGSQLLHCTPPPAAPPLKQRRSFIVANNCSPVGELRAAVRGMCQGRTDPAPTEPMLQVA